MESFSYTDFISEVKCNVFERNLFWDREGFVSVRFYTLGGQIKFFSFGFVTTIFIVDQLILEKKQADMAENVAWEGESTN